MNPSGKIINCGHETNAVRTKKLQNVKENKPKKPQSFKNQDPYLVRVVHTENLGEEPIFLFPWNNMSLPTAPCIALQKSIQRSKALHAIGPEPLSLLICCFDGCLLSLTTN